MGELPPPALRHHLPRVLRGLQRALDLLDDRQGHPQQQYLKAALQAISDAKLHSNARFLGTALWGFASKMAYPPQSDNTFTPGTPFVDKGEEDFLQTYILSLRGSIPLGDRWLRRQ